MASLIQLTMLAELTVKEVKASKLPLEEVDLVEVAAILIHAKHLDGNTEGQAEVSTEGWPDVSLAWKSRYRNLARQFFQK
ncbi:MAG: hypothetical protein G01um101429_67 [Parcubacteria group bacterium Gr01-1014_29]|nr:MAG: hypothetical protein G01um101429_67 [Parcubacteria group bacterium Gr01-1014_29]